ncbi:MAG: HAD-IA family hydrolase [Porticoccaceae bacterium]|nr:HAD-IA family hydrolase [Porticoccaceae bacterium]
MLIFDWDGTLCDSIERIAHCLQLAADDEGLPIPSLAEGRDIVGLGMREALEQLFPGIESDQVTRLRDSYATHFVREDAEPSPFFPGALEALHHFREQGRVLAVATGKSRRGLDRVLAKLDMSDFFHATICADETASKPDPLMLKTLLADQGLAPQAALMIGDTVFDMAMAQHIAMPRLAVSYGAHSVERLLGYDPIACVDHCGEFADCIAAHYS